LKKAFFRAAAITAAILVITPCVTAFARDEIRYEYKIVRLGSLTSLQDKDKSDAKTREVEEILNKEGAQGWEVVNIFAVRTTFDPNVFFAAMKRSLTETKAEEN
jgi:hypothetical protein